MFEQAFKNIDDVLWKEAGCTTELDYTEQTSWLLFLKYLDDLEQDKATEATLAGKKYTHILDKPYRWESWAAPKGKDGKLDHNKALTGDDLRDFVQRADRADGAGDRGAKRAAAPGDSGRQRLLFGEEPGTSGNGRRIGTFHRCLYRDGQAEARRVPHTVLTRTATQERDPGGSHETQAPD